MDWPVFFPNVKSKSTKDLILRLLTQEKSMTNQKIFSNIKKQFGISVTYQTVRQALMELTDSNVLEKEGKEYFICTKWIQTLHDYSSLLKKKYLDKVDIKIIDKNTKELHLDSLYALGHFILYSFKDQFFDLNNEQDLYMMIHHVWFPFFDSDKRKMLENFFSTNKNFIYCVNKGMLNRVFSVFYKKFGKVKLGVKFDDFFDIIIQGNCVAKIYMPSELRKRMDSLYKNKNPLKINNIHELSDLTFAKYPIKISIIRDKQMADEIKARIKSI